MENDYREIKTSPKEFCDAVNAGLAIAYYVNNIGHRIGRWSHKAWLNNRRCLIIDDTDVKFDIREE